MAIVSRNQLKAWFRKGLKPLESQFANWIDSFWHKNDKIPMASVEGLNEAFNDIGIRPDDTLDENSTNPIQNAPVARALANKAPTSHTHYATDINDLQSTVEQTITENLQPISIDYINNLQ